jgi:transposase
MGKDSTTKFIGLDVHSKTISVAIADEGRKGEVRYFGTIDNTTEAIEKVIKSLTATGAELRFIYEAGPCGFALYRYLTGNGFKCIVTSPAMIPKRGNVRIKNDRRDALTLARLYRAGELTGIYVPDPEDEAIRDLTRARNDARQAERKAKQRLNSFLLRNNLVYPRKTKWNRAYFYWLGFVVMKHPAQKIALQEYIEAVHEGTERVKRLSEQISLAVEEWRMAPTVKALQSLRGVSLITATITVAELGDISRFSHPKELMAYLGLVPSEHSSGETIRRGHITKTGNSHARRVLVESAWTYKHHARVTLPLIKRQEGLPRSICQISCKAQLRLCARYRRMVARKKPMQVVAIAIAREIAAFMWAIAKEVEATA